MSDSLAIIFSSAFADSRNWSFVESPGGDGQDQDEAREGQGWGEVGEGETGLESGLV